MDTISNKVLYLTNEYGMTRSEAEAWIEKKYAEREARWEREEAARKAHEEAVRDLPADEATIKKVVRKLGRPMHKSQRSDWRQLLGDQRWQQIANPQTREAGLATLTQLEAEKLLKFRN